MLKEELKEIIKKNKAKGIVGNGINIYGQGVLLLGGGKSTTSVYLVLHGGSLVGDDYIAFWRETPDCCYMCSLPGYACGPFLRGNIKDLYLKDLHKVGLDRPTKKRDTCNIIEFSGREDAYLRISPINYVILMSEREDVKEYFGDAVFKEARKEAVEISSDDLLEIVRRGITPNEIENIESLISCSPEVCFTAVRTSLRRAKEIINFIRRDIHVN